MFVGLSIQAFYNEDVYNTMIAYGIYFGGLTTLILEEAVAFTIEKKTKKKVEEVAVVVVEEEEEAICVSCRHPIPTTCNVSSSYR